MGATESIFFDDEPSVSSMEQMPPSYPPALPPHGDRQHGQNNGPRVVRRPKRRSRPGTAAGSDVPVKLLHGILLGRVGSGKKTLLERLKGRDPFDDEEGESGDEETTAVVPYQAPAGSSVWDRVQIKVRISQEIPIENPVDFAVILINPKDPQSQTQSYLNQVLPCLLQAYEQGRQRRQSNGSGNQRQEANQQYGQRPFCVCFLVNFRDLQQSKKQGIQDSDIKQCALGILQQYAERLPRTDQVLLQFVTTSLYNCFGLSTLHHFIYNTYLRVKRSELELQLLDVHEEVSRSKEAPRVKYKEFLKLVEGSKSTLEKRKKGGKGRSNQGSNRHNGPSLQSHAREDTEGQHPQSHANDEGAEINKSKKEAESKQREVNGGRRQITAAKPHPQRQQVEPDPPVYVNSKDALEAFLASDEEEEVVSIKKSGKGNVFSSEDDDDDFFYNEVGERVHGGIQGKATQLSRKNDSQSDNGDAICTSISTQSASVQNKSEIKTEVSSNDNSYSQKSLEQGHQRFTGLADSSTETTRSKPGAQSVGENHAKEEAKPRSADDNESGEQDLKATRRPPDSQQYVENNDKAQITTGDRLQQNGSKTVADSEAQESCISEVDKHRDISQSTETNEVSNDVEVDLTEPPHSSDQNDASAIQCVEENEDDDTIKGRKQPGHCKVSKLEKDFEESPAEIDGDVGAIGVEKQTHEKSGDMDADNKKVDQGAGEGRGQADKSRTEKVAPMKDDDEEELFIDESESRGSDNEQGSKTKTNDTAATIIPRNEGVDGEEEEFCIDESPNRASKTRDSEAADSDEEEFFIDESVVPPTNRNSKNRDDGAEGSDEEEEFFIDESMVTPPDQDLNDKDDGDNDTEEEVCVDGTTSKDEAEQFIGAPVEEEHDPTSRPDLHPGSPKPAIDSGNSDEVDKVEDNNVRSGTGIQAATDAPACSSLSAAALAAIAAAQKEAELMLQQSLYAAADNAAALSEKSMKKKKKKKKEKKVKKGKETDD